MMNPFGFFKMGFGLFGVLFTLVFLLVFVLILFTLIKGLGQYRRNNASPVLTVEAKVVSKRTAIGRHAGHAHNGHHHAGSTYTSYFATFEVESGDRIELSVAGQEFGLLVEGDTGRLTFQGTRYKGFTRKGRPV